jgi:hypothetical protein
MVCNAAAEIEKKKFKWLPIKKNTKNLISCILYFFFKHVDVLAALSVLSFPGCPVPAVLSWQSRSACPFPRCSVFAVLSCLSRPDFPSLQSSLRCPLRAVLSWLSLPGCHFQAVLSYQSCSGCTVLAIFFWLPFLAVLS